MAQDPTLFWGFLILLTPFALYIGITFLMFGWVGGKAKLKETVDIVVEFFVATLFVAIFLLALPVLWVMEKGDPGNRGR